MFLYVVWTENVPKNVCTFYLSGLTVVTVNFFFKLN